ncbi:MAG TPA: ABC transporter substrate-binding protein [Polyangiaceae bacterium]|nr:ABC transporter substrate-binding protein [Polyangiaceae bacterium]
MRSRSLLSALALLASFAGCAPEEREIPADAIKVGAVLPFTGKEAAIGRNLEQALLLAVKDVNEAGGVRGRPLHLVTRDSNSGSARGLDALLELLYLEEVEYLIGPEENELANDIVPDVKALDVLNLLPGYSAPAMKRGGTRGAWVRLAPSPAAIGCAMARQAIAEGVDTANSIVALDDYNLSLAAEFNAQFVHLGGRALPSVTISAGASSYRAQIAQALDYEADRTLLIAYPATASVVATEWTIGRRRGAFTLSPMLHADAFLVNTPFGALDGFAGLSPSLSLTSECDSGTPNGPVSCSRENARAFSDHFAARWEGDRPFPAAHFYYDAVVLLAMALERELARGNDDPTAPELRDAIRELGGGDAEPAHWSELSPALAALADGGSRRYVGAAAEYDFDEFGIARHVVFDTWSIARGAFVETGRLMASCPRHL